MFNTAEEWRPHLHRGRRLKSRTAKLDSCKRTTTFVSR